MSERGLSSQDLRFTRRLDKFTVWVDGKLGNNPNYHYFRQGVRRHTTKNAPKHLDETTQVKTSLPPISEMRDGNYEIKGVTVDLKTGEHPNLWVAGQNIQQKRTSGTLFIARSVVYVDLQSRGEDGKMLVTKGSYVLTHQVVDEDPRENHTSKIEGEREVFVLQNGKIFDVLQKIIREHIILR